MDQLLVIGVEKGVLMIIRQEQYEAFEGDIRSRYCKSLQKFFRDTIPETVASHDDATLLARILAAEGRGREWGIKLQTSMVRFIALDLLMGERFDTLPEVRRLFGAPGTSIDMKVHVLGDLIEDNLRREAQGGPVRS
jgi:hypothetical protein